MNKDVGLELCCMEKFVSVVVPKERREVVFFFRSKPEEFFGKGSFTVVGKQRKIIAYIANILN